MFHQISKNVAQHKDGTIVRCNSRFKIECIKSHARATMYIEPALNCDLVYLDTLEVWADDSKREQLSPEEVSDWLTYIMGGLKFLGVECKYVRQS